MPAINSSSPRRYQQFEEWASMHAISQPEKVSIRERGEVEERINRAYRDQNEAWMRQHGLIHEEFGSARTLGALDRLFMSGSKPLKGRPFK